MIKKIAIKMRFIKTMLVLGIAVCTAIQVSLAQEKSELAEDHATSFFPIMAWDWNYEDWNFFATHPDQRLEQLKMMKACGFTIAGLFREPELDIVQEAGLKALIIDPRITYDWVGWLQGKELKINETEAREKIKSLVAEVKGRSVIYGYYVVDEPGYDVLPAVGAVTQLLKELDPSRIAYVNLHPNYAPPKYIGGDYDRYLKKYSELSRPNMLSVDNYFLMRPDEKVDANLVAQFYLNMAQMRDASLEQKVPFWSVLLSMPHQTYVKITRANMARQVYASLAYGARGLSYFCYFQNRSPDATSAPIDREGNKTPIWDIVSELNHEVLALAPTLNRLTILKNYFLGPVPSGSEPPPENALVRNVGKSNPQLLVGEFLHDDGTNYIMIVNTNVKHDASVALKFPGTVSVKIVGAKDGVLREGVGDFDLAAGAGILLKLSKSK